jgi:hypothetical protein
VETSGARLVRSLRTQAYMLSALFLILGGLLLITQARTPIDWPQLLGTTLLGTGLISAVWQILVDRWQKADLIGAVRAALSATDPRLGLRTTRLGDITRAELEVMLSNCRRASLVRAPNAAGALSDRTDLRPVGHAVRLLPSGLRATVGGFPALCTRGALRHRKRTKAPAPEGGSRRRRPQWRVTCTTEGRGPRHSPLPGFLPSLT